jgi:hypothetical protein
MHPSNDLIQFISQKSIRLAKCFIVAVLVLTLSGIILPAHGQEWNPIIITNNLGVCYAIDTGDINGNGHDTLDVGVTDWSGNQGVWWFEAPAWNPHHFGTLGNAAFLKIVDMDADNDLDVVVASIAWDDVIWFENDGLTWFRRYIDTNLDGAVGVDAADMDGDGDMDVVASGFAEGIVVWYRNEGGTPITWIRDTIGVVNAPTKVVITDINSDDTLDVVTVGSGNDDVVWFEAPGWIKRIIDNNLDSSDGLSVGDIDGDGNLDVVASGYNINDVVWYKNIDGTGTTWSRLYIDSNFDGASQVSVSDIDGDNRLDVVAGTYSVTGKVVWYKNQGGDPISWNLNIIDSNLVEPGFVHTTDMDHDNDIDVLVGKWTPGEVIWYENTLPTIINVPADVPTIQAGIDSASYGNIVLVEDGTYLENINFKGKAITVASHFLTDGDTNHINNTIIDGSQPNNPDSGSVVLFVSGEDTNSVLTGFTITGGSGTVNSSLNYRGGGGIYCYNSGSRLESNKIINNSVDFTIEALGGGIAVDASHEVDVIIRENKISGNTVTGVDGAYGGGVEFMNTSGEITGNIVSYNNCESSASQANSGGLGFWSNSTDTPFVVIKNNRITHNTASGTDSGNLSGGATGGVGVFGCYARIQQNEISYNVISGTGDAFGAGVGCGDIHDNLIIDNNYIAFNTIEQGDGWGGGLCIYRASAIVVKNKIMSNNATSFGSLSRGGGIWVRGNSTVNIINNTILFNEATYGGGIATKNSTTTIKNSILWGDSAVSGHHEIYFDGGSCDVDYCDIEGGWPYPSIGNINADPLLYDSAMASGDTTYCCLPQNSPCVDAGDPHPLCNDPEDPLNPGFALWPAMGTIRNDMGAHGGISDSLIKYPEVMTIRRFNDIVPTQYALSQNYPNPFNPGTTIEFALPRTSEVTLNIYNILGEVVETVVSERLTAGTYQYEWFPSSLASGVYFYTLDAGDFTQTRKLILLR